MLLSERSNTVLLLPSSRQLCQRRRQRRGYQTRSCSRTTRFIIQIILLLGVTLFFSVPSTITTTTGRRNNNFLPQVKAFSTATTRTVFGSVLYQPPPPSKLRYGTQSPALLQNYGAKRNPLTQSRLSLKSSLEDGENNHKIMNNDNDENLDKISNGKPSSLSSSSSSAAAAAASSSASRMMTNMNPSTIPLRHVAFICDGNSRWAKAQHLPTYMGYKQGADRLVQLLEHIASTSSTTTTTTATSTTLNIDYVTVYGFSTENWQRTATEIQEIFAVMEFTAQSLIQLLHLQQKKQQQLHQHQPWWSSSSNQPSLSLSPTKNHSFQQQQQKRPIQVRILGDLDDPRMPNTTRNVLKKLEQETTTVNNDNDDDSNHNDTLTVCLAINYGGRQDIVTACQALAQQVADGILLPNQITQQHVQQHLSYTSTIPDPDIVIRTSGEYRLSNFLLWNVAYTELYFVDTLWPDFDLSQWQKALQWYLERQRRFGNSSSSTTSSSRTSASFSSRG